MSKPGKIKMIKGKKYLRIGHQMVYIRPRNHMIDVFILPVCRRLWDEGIDTFYSCQGGPIALRLKDGKIAIGKAYVVVLRQDAKRACRILKHLNPKIDTKVQGISVAIRLDPSDEAKNVDIVLSVGGQGSQYY